MCQKNVIMFTCGHTRLLNFSPCNKDGIVCPDPKRILIPQEGGIGIEIPKDKIVWTCALKCVEGKPAHDPLIDLAKENAAHIKANIGQQIETLSALTTPMTTPITTPSIEQEGFSFDRTFSQASLRRMDMKLRLPVG